MSVKETINTVFAKLPFKALAEKIPAEARTKVPLLDKAIPFANQIVCGLAVLLVVTVVACSGKGGSSGGSSGSKIKFTMAKESDFVVELLADGTASITKYKGKGGNIDVPATIQGVQVTKIGNNAFQEIDLLTVSSIRLPEGLKEIGSGAFKGNRINTIIIPDSVTVFGTEIFYLTGIGSFTFPAGLIASKKIPDSLFSGTAISGSLVIPEGIETIENGAFWGTGFTSVTLPSTIKGIETNAFNGCVNLTEVIIPASVTSIQWDQWDNMNQFLGCSKLNLATQARLKELGYTGRF